MTAGATSNGVVVVDAKEAGQGRGAPTSCPSADLIASFTLNAANRAGFDAAAAKKWEARTGARRAKAWYFLQPTED